MAVRQKHIDDQLLNSAKECFLEKGYLATMLRDVCQKAGVTTGALYKRYKSKEELFDAVVEPAVQKLNDIVNRTVDQDVSKYSDEQLLKPWVLSEQNIQYWFTMLEEIKDGFVLLVSNKSDGSRYSNFHHDWVQKLTEIDLRNILTKPKNAIIKQYQALLKMDDVKLKFSKDAIDYIVKESIKKGTGARGLKSVLSDRLNDLMYVKS